MGTRGAFGVRVDGVDKVTYNHFDSYPEGLGEDLAKQLAAMMKRKQGLEGLRAQAREVVVLDEDSEDTVSIIAKKLGGRYHHQGVSTGQDAYSMVRNLQGDLKAILDDAQLMLDSHDFLKDSLFCEWAYIANLDTGVLEVYRGFQRSPGKGRYAALHDGSEYAPVSLVAELPLDTKLVSSMQKLIKELGKEEEE